MSIDSIIGLFQIYKRPEYIFPIARYISHTCLTANTWSMHPLPCLNPHCYSPIAHSVPALTLLISTLPNGLPTTLNKLIPLELLHSHLSPAPLYRGTIHAPRQSICTTPISKLQFISLTSRSNTAIPPFFKHFKGNQSSPGAFPDFISFTASPTTSNDILFHSYFPTAAPANCQLH